MTSIIDLSIINSICSMTGRSSTTDGDTTPRKTYLSLVSAIRIAFNKGTNSGQTTDNYHSNNGLFPKRNILR